MSGRRGRRWAGIVVVTVLALLALVPLLAGRPLAAYPVSRSMEPTIGAFDVYFVDPFPGPIREGDVIVFQSHTQGGPAVHRVVGGDAHGGWLTKGDANPNVDQAGAEPPVMPDQVLGRVVTTPDGAPLLLPRAGIPFAEAHARASALAGRVGGTANLAGAAFLVAAALLAVPAFARRPAGARPAGLPSRSARRWLRRLLPRGVQGRHVAVALLALLAASAVWGAQRANADVRMSLIVVRDPTLVDEARTVVPGGSLPREIEVTSLGFLPTFVVADAASPGVVADGAHGVVPPGGKASLHVRQVGGDELGHQPDTVRVWRYPDVMPRAWALRLHELLPGAPYYAVAAAAGIAGAGWYVSMDVARRPVGAWLGLREGWL